MGYLASIKFTHVFHSSLEAKLNQCPTSDQRDQARLAVDHAKQIAEQFI
jgi:hypothetical protein